MARDSIFWRVDVLPCRPPIKSSEVNDVGHRSNGAGLRVPIEMDVIKMTKDIRMADGRDNPPVISRYTQIYVFHARVKGPCRDLLEPSR